MVESTSVSDNYTIAVTTKYVRTVLKSHSLFYSITIIICLKLQKLMT